MIEVVADSRCIRCDICIRVCPTDVFERGAAGLPEITRQGDCQTCFMCEAWCPTDALFVAPQTEPLPTGSPLRDEDELVRRGLLGSYRRVIGWGPGREPGARHDRSFNVLGRLHGVDPPRLAQYASGPGPKAVVDAPDHAMEMEPDEQP